jgi:hypothetical protein
MRLVIRAAMARTASGIWCLTRNSQLCNVRHAGCRLPEAVARPEAVMSKMASLLGRAHIGR